MNEPKRFDQWGAEIPTARMAEPRPPQRDDERSEGERALARAGQRYPAERVSARGDSPSLYIKLRSNCERILPPELLAQVLEGLPS